MSTLIPGPILRQVTGDSFADITDSGFSPVAEGLLFDADLDDTQVAAITAWLASKDDADLTAREQLAAALDGTGNTAGTGPATNLAAITAAYLLGRDLPAPEWPAPPAEGPVEPPAAPA